jgi:hypothetical protein
MEYKGIYEEHLSSWEGCPKYGALVSTLESSEFLNLLARLVFVGLDGRIYGPYLITKT